MNKDIIKELITSIKEDNLSHIKEIIVAVNYLSEGKNEIRPI